MGITECDDGKVHIRIQALRSTVKMCGVHPGYWGGFVSFMRVYLGS